jgi:hypothetical protein
VHPMVPHIWQQIVFLLFKSQQNREINMGSCTTGRVLVYQICFVRFYEKIGNFENLDNFGEGASLNSFTIMVGTTSAKSGALTKHQPFSFHMSNHK